MSVRLVADREIRQAILELIGNAQQEITLVSPFNHDLPDLVTALKDAHQRGVKISRYFQDGKRDPVEHFGGVASFPVPNLHAKVYANEHTILITSCNLNWGSWNQNREVGLLVQDATLHNEIADFVNTLGTNTPRRGRRSSRPLGVNRTPRARNQSSNIVIYIIRDEEPDGGLQEIADDDVWFGQDIPYLLAQGELEENDFEAVAEITLSHEWSFLPTDPGSEFPFWGIVGLMMIQKMPGLPTKFCTMKWEKE